MPRNPVWMATLDPLSIGVLAVLPKEPYTVSARDIADELFGGHPTTILAIVKRALNRHAGIVYRQFAPDKAYGHKEGFAVRAERWEEVHTLLMRLYDPATVGEVVAKLLKESLEAYAQGGGDPG